MREKYLIVVDMQNDFVTGSLGTEEAKAIRSRVLHKVRDFKGNVIFTLDTHNEDYLNTQEGKRLPVSHCIKGTEGWELIPELKEIQVSDNYMTFEKNTFGSRSLAGYLSDKYGRGEVESVELIGLCTDICVVSNALLIKAYMPELSVMVDASCCAGVTQDKHEAALRTMESCQIVLENWRKEL